MGCEKDAFVMMQMAIAIIMWLSLLLLIHRLSFLFYFFEQIQYNMRGRSE